MLDKELVIEPGSLPVKMVFPHIKNFNAELSSGAISIKTIYNGLVIDESGSSTVGRKAVTGVLATTLTVKEFKISPTTEGVPANYTMKIDPGVNISSTYFIRL